MAKKIAPHEDATKFAMRMLDVDRRSLGAEPHAVDVTRSGDAWIATSKGRGGCFWFLLCAFLGPIGLLIAAVSPRRD